MFEEFLSSRANYCCRYCDADSKKRDDLLRNTILHDWYHHQITIIRNRSRIINDKINRLIFLTRNELKFELFALKILISTFDFMMSCSSDFAHSEYYELVRKFFLIIYFKIFTIRVAKKFIKQFQFFSFSSNWERKQFSTTHMIFWSMNKCERVSIVISIFFRCWLKLHHVRQSYKNDLNFEIFKEIRSMSNVNFIVSEFDKLIKSNSLISSFELFIRDRNDFHINIMNVRRFFFDFDECFSI